LFASTQSKEQNAQEIQKGRGTKAGSTGNAGRDAPILLPPTQVITAADEVLLCWLQHATSGVKAAHNI
jgi:hypothetical protein